jgi:hypothetical protein
LINVIETNEWGFQGCWTMLKVICAMADDVNYGDEGDANSQRREDGLCICGLCHILLSTAAFGSLCSVTTQFITLKNIP